MAISTMYPAKPGSPETTLTASIAANATSMTVADSSVLPAAPNICVIGSESNAEIVTYTGINGNTISGLVRAIGGTTASVWEAGTVVARNFTSYDHDTFKENIETLNSEKIDGVAWGDITGTLSNQSDLSSEFALKAPLASPDLTGTPTAPTAAAGTSTTQIATTAFATTADNKVKDQFVTIAETLRGKKVSIIGDSISTFTGYLPSGYYSRYPDGTVTDVNQTWWQQLIDFCGATLEVNASYRGSCASNIKAGTSPGSGYINYPDFYDRSNTATLGSPDVIIVALGTNDWSNSVVIGDYDYTTEYTSLPEETFATAYIKGVKALQAIYPSAEIICIALGMVPEYATAIKNIAKQLGCHYAYAGDYQRETGIHPGVSGMKEIALSVMTANKAIAYDTGWNTYVSDIFSEDHNTIYYRQVGNMVTVTGYNLNLATAWSSGAMKTIISSGTLPKPPITAIGFGGKIGKYVMIGVGAGGGLIIYRYTADTWATTDNISFVLTYMTA